MSRRLLIIQPCGGSHPLLDFLQSNRISFEILPDLVSGLQKAQEQHYDVILMDTRSHGIKIDRAIRLLKVFDPQVRIIVQTDENSRRLEARVRREQIYYYHLNSFGADDLATAVITALASVNRRSHIS